MLRGQFSNRVIIILHIVMLAVFVTGLILNNCFGYTLPGIICQVIAYIYTAATFYLKAFQRSNGIQRPTDFFSDRQETLELVVERLYEISTHIRNDQVIPIACSGSSGSGKTQILLKIAQILTNRKEAKSQLPPESYKKYKHVVKTIGNVNFYEYDEGSTISAINNSRYVYGHKNVAIVDDLPSFAINRFNEQSIIIFCKPEKYDGESPKSTIRLESFNRENVQVYYFDKFGERIDESLLNSIMRYSDGNVAQITSILSNQESINLFVNSAPVLFEIESLIDSGDYKRARQQIDNLPSSKKSEIDSDEESSFRFKFLNADLIHLENKYDESLELMEMLRAEYMRDERKHRIIIDKIAHIKKHLGHFDDAISELESLPEESAIFKKLSLNLLAYCQKEDKRYLDATNSLLHRIKNEAIREKDVRRNSYDTYKAVTVAYEGKYDSAHAIIDKAIKKYEIEDSKYLNNCYFIKAEIFRHQKNYKRAYDYYQKCLDAYFFNDDLDVYSLAFVMISYINEEKGFRYKIDMTYDLENLKQICHESKMSYNKKLCMCLSQLIVAKKQGGEKEASEISRYFDKYYFLIP